MRQKLLKKNEQTGFTIIEVVLVLAIAGLIFLIVFLALPSLQRSRRDSQRKSDAGRLVAAINNYQSNSKSELPEANNDDCDYVIDNYLTVDGSVFADPQYGDYSCDNTNVDLEDSEMAYREGEDCDGGGGARNFAALVALEEGGEYCQDNR